MLKRRQDNQAAFLNFKKNESNKKIQALARGYNERNKQSRLRDQEIKNERAALKYEHCTVTQTKQLFRTYGILEMNA